MNKPVVRRDERPKQEPRKGNCESGKGNCFYEPIEISTSTRNGPKKAKIIRNVNIPMRQGTSNNPAGIKAIVQVKSRCSKCGKDKWVEQDRLITVEAAEDILKVS